MKRYLFFFLFVGAILASTYFAICGDAGFNAGMKSLGNLIESVIDLSLFEAGFNALTIPIYGLLIFLFINAVLLLSLLLMVLSDLERFSKVRKFYAGVKWFFLGALLFTGAYVYSIYDAVGSFDGILDVLAEQKWHFYLPIGSSFILLIISFIFRKTESIY